jgi:hypothetical protein
MLRHRGSARERETTTRRNVTALAKPNPRAPIERQYALLVKVQRDGVLSFDFAGIDLTTQTLDRIAGDLEVAATAMRENRDGILMGGRGVASGAVR